MEFLKELQGKALLIVPSSMRISVLEYISTLDFFPNVKIMTFTELLKKCDFDYGKEAVIFLSKKYHVSPEVSKIYIKNMYYLDSKFPPPERIHHLIQKKEELFQHKLIERDDLFIESLKDWTITFYGYDYFLREENNVIEQLRKITKVEIISSEVVPPKLLTVHHFQTIEEELEYVFETICDLLSYGISCGQIKIVDLPSEYRFPLMRFAKLYHVPVALSEKVSIYETMVGKKAIQKLHQGLSFSEIIEQLIEEFPNSEIPMQILEIFNSYVCFSSLDNCIYDSIIKDMKETFIKVERKKEEIDFVSLHNYQINSDDYLFVLGFNNKNFPKVLKDEEYIHDSEKITLGFTTTEEKNKLERDAFMKHLFQAEHLIITYKLTTPFDTYYPSILVQDYQMKVIDQHENFSVHHSKKYDAIKLASMLDDFIQLGKKHPLLDLYRTNIPTFYRTYNHQFQGIDKHDLKEYLDSKLTLSYSAIDCFYHCQFRYYLQNILKITKYEETFSTIIGNIFHTVLSRSFQENFVFSSAYQEECKAYQLSSKETFYLDKLKPELEFIIETIKEQNQILGFSNAFYEKRFLAPLKMDFPVNFVGFIDKILWRDVNGRRLVSIIDYKTGSFKLDLRLVPLGFSLQLPVYMYLLHRSKDFQDSQIVGIYLQKILESVPPNTPDVAMYKRNSLKLFGYSIDDEDLLMKWDPTYESSEVIKSLKKTKNGWYSYAKLLSQNEMERLIKLVSDKIDMAAAEILKGSFSINPKRILGKNVGCEFCKFHDICFQKEQDMVDLKTNRDLSFLRED